ncbi:cell envelope integrity TolA C-terminal domain-containing protein [Escherichia coli]
MKGHLYDWDTYKGKTCTLRVNMTETVLCFEREAGRWRSGVLSADALAAGTNRMTKFPKPPSQSVWQTLKMRHWTSSHNGDCFFSRQYVKNKGEIIAQGFGSFVYFSLLTFC